MKVLVVFSRSRRAIHRLPIYYYFPNSDGQFSIHYYVGISHLTNVHRVITCSEITCWLLFTRDRCCCRPSVMEGVAYFLFFIRGRRAGRLRYCIFIDRRQVKNEKLMRNNFNLNVARLNNESCFFPNKINIYAHHLGLRFLNLKKFNFKKISIFRFLSLFTL